MGLFSFLGWTKGHELKEGDLAPVLTVQDQDGHEINLAEYYEKDLTLIYFYPKADTPGCAKQGCSLRDAYDRLTAKGIAVLGVSHDSPEAQRAFKAKYQLPFPLIPDQDKTLIKAFGVPTLAGAAKRQAYLIKNGQIVWRDLAASTSQQAEDVFRAVEAQR
jgi:peroxiredoxin Q/BCP